MATTVLRNTLTAIATETIAAVNPTALLAEVCQVVGSELRVARAGAAPISYDLSAFGSIYLCAIGKAAAPMAHYFLETAAIDIADGIIITKQSAKKQIGTLPIRLGGHPLPTHESIANGAALIALATRANSDTLVINCISGGASALCVAPRHQDELTITLDDYRILTQLLLDHGLTIEQSNCVRSQLSRIKGGKYLQLLHPARALTLILSDVRYDNLQVIGSGLTAAPASTQAQAIAILQTAGIWAQTPARIRRLLSANDDDRAVRQAKNDNVIIGNTARALAAAATAASARGYAPTIITDCLFGEAAAAAAHIAAVAAYHLRYRQPRERRCILFGGETTVTIRGSGRGGRNQELAAMFLKIAVADQLLSAQAEHIAMISFATDGNDGPTDAAGGIVDAHSRRALAAQALNIDAALANNDSYYLLQRLDSLYQSGYSATNVCDVQCVLID